MLKLQIFKKPYHFTNINKKYTNYKLFTSNNINIDNNGSNGYGSGSQSSNGSNGSNGTSYTLTSKNTKLNPYLPTKDDTPTIQVSKIRSLDIGKNYFSKINPKRRKYLITLLNSYTKSFPEEDCFELEDALDIYFNNHFNGKPICELKDEKLNLSLHIINHLYFLMVIDRLSSSYSRYDFTDYHLIIQSLNTKPKEQRNKAKYVFTSHPTQPNSIEQLNAITEILKGLEENDTNYMDYWMRELINVTKTRKFEKPSYLQESVVYHTLYLKNMIRALGMAVELGLKEPYDYFEIPGTWMAFDFDNHPGMELGIMTFTHGMLIELTINQYKRMIEKAMLIDFSVFNELMNNFRIALDYADRLQVISGNFLNKKIDKEEFFRSVGLVDLRKVDERILNILNSLQHHWDEKPKALATKLYSLFRIFRLSGCLGQIRFAGEDLMDKDETTVKPIVLDILKELSLMQLNYQAVDMIIVANYQRTQQFDLLQKLLDKFKISGVEIVPLLEAYASQNETKSKITMIASSDTRQRDGLILTELRTLQEYINHPFRYIYMGQGITPERGGGPYKLIHQKYRSLTPMQRKRHIRTVQGHYFTSEFASRDLTFTFLTNGINNLNRGDDFIPTPDYINFLAEIDYVVGKPQREMQKTEEFNNLYVKNPIIKTLVETFNFAGSRELGKPLNNVKGQRAIVQAYINSDRCSFTHPELAFWDKLNDHQIAIMARYYYDNHPHFKYMIHMYAYMCKRFDLELAVSEVGLDYNNPTFLTYQKGKEALMRILNYCGINEKSVPMDELWKQHLGLQGTSSTEEVLQKEVLFKTIVKLQNYHVKEFLREQILDSTAKDQESLNLRKLRILQSALANMTSYTGKG
jgi:hypothetical protein